MKKVILLSVVLLMSFSASLQAQSDTLKVVVSGIKIQKGQISIGLYNQADKFPKNKGALTGTNISVKGDSAVWVFRNLQPGTYAIAVYHDLNSDGELSSNFIGIPNEPYAFSNNATGSFGPPDFDAAKFDLHTTSVMRIKLNE